MTTGWIISRRIKILVHVLVWLTLFILPTYLLSGKTVHDKGFVREVWFQIAFYCILFYLSYLWLIPAFFSKGKKTVWFVSIIVITALMAFATGEIRTRLREIYEEPPPRFIPPVSHQFRKNTEENAIPARPDRRPGPGKAWPYFNFILTASLISGLSLGLRFSEKMNEQEKMVKEAEKQRIDQELAFLRYQINPHFMFNTLNTIYSLALMKSDHTPDAVMKLSGMMRYVLQDVQPEKVSLESEFSYIRDYIELQKLRLSANVTVDLVIPEDSRGLEIAPVLLVPFIENTFKHGTSAHENIVIKINLKILDKYLVLLTENRIFQERPGSGISGIGIANTKKRLDLIYSGKYTLDLTREDGLFKVNLTINLA